MNGSTNNPFSRFGGFVVARVALSAVSGVADRIGASGDDALEPKLTFMKFVFLAGGFAGFLIAAAGSFWAGHQPDRVFLDGAVGCLAGALLFRWFWTVLVRGIRETIMARHAAAAAAAPAKNK